MQKIEKQISLELFKHSVPVQIRFNDLDLMGHVNNTEYINYFGVGRLKYFDLVFENIIDWKNFGVVLVKTTVDYLKPIYLHDSIIVYSRTNQVGTKSFEMEQAIYNQNMELNAINKSVIVCYDFFKKISIEIPVAWKEKIRNFEIFLED
ncbi:MAG: hypothetical protein A2046_00875 [Bacteroidetes bacterium GWA2_30_7]|nr:MAG: hypothetical protein A2046_00875 [Bacteroidetes bacterium GWA2_30_7]